MGIFIAAGAISLAIITIGCFIINAALDELQDFLDDDNDWPGSPRL